MPVKGSKTQKAAKESTPEPPKSKVKFESKATPTKSTSTKAVTPKKAKEPTVFQPVMKDGEGAIPIDVSLTGSSIHSSPQKGGGGYTHILKLEAPASFSILKTMVLTEGPLEGNQVIVLRPAKAFPFLKLPKEVKGRIYGYYFAQKGMLLEPVVLDGKRANKEIYAKTYAEGNKYRVGLLAANREIHEEAIQIFYAQTLKLESTSTLLDFLSQIPTFVRPLLKDIEIKNYIKTTSRNAMHFLAEAKNLERLHIESGVFSEGDPAKAAKHFYADTYKFLEALAKKPDADAGGGESNTGEGRDGEGKKKKKPTGVDVLSFGKLALTFKDEKKVSKPWAETLVEGFKDTLRAKLKSVLDLNINTNIGIGMSGTWSCVCGIGTKGHICALELRKQRSGNWARDGLGWWM